MQVSYGNDRYIMNYKHVQFKLISNYSCTIGGKKNNGTDVVRNVLVPHVGEWGIRIATEQITPLKLLSGCWLVGLIAFWPNSF